MGIFNLKQESDSAKRKLLLAAALGSSLIVAGCADSNNDDSDDNDTVAQASFDITITNLSAAQPLSPVAIALHSAGWQAFTTGTSASVGLENLAESGDNSGYLDEAEADSDVYATASGSGIIGPGGSETVSVNVNENLLGTLSLSAVSMLVNTNDAIAALNGQTIADFELNDTAAFTALSYDTGTEANSETADTIPGPAAAGGTQEGFNAARDDVRDAIYVHAGVVTQSDGLATSTLTELHRWDHPAIRVTVERTQ